MSTTEVKGLIYVILIILGIIYCIIKIGQAKKELKMEENQKQQQKETKVLATRNLLMSTLRGIGCQPEIDEDGDVRFQYQGGIFYGLVGGKTIQILYPNWEEFDIQDVNIKNVYTAINEVNKSNRFGRISYHITEENAMLLQSTYSTIFSPDMPLKDLLRVSLRDLFQTQHMFLSEYAELK